MPTFFTSRTCVPGPFLGMRHRCCVEVNQGRGKSTASADNGSSMQNQNTTDGMKKTPAVLPTSGQAPQPPRTALSDFSRRVVVAVLITLLLLTVAYVLWRGVHVLLVVFAGILFAVFLSALAEWLSSHSRLRRGWALTVVVLVLFVVVGGVGWLLANQLARQTAELVHKLPQSFEQLRNYLAQYEWGRLLLEQLPKDRESLGQIAKFAPVPGLVSGIGEFLVNIVLIFFVGIFGAAEPTLYREGLLHLLPPSQRQRTREAVDVVALNLRWWLVGQLWLMVILWLTTTAGLWLLGVPLALVLGFIAGILELVPYIGPWLSAVPAVLMSLTLSPVHVLLTGGLYLLLHILEGYVLLPLIQRRAVEMPPAVTLVAQVLLGELLGIMGLFVAAPLTVCVVVLAKMLYVEDTLGDQAVDVPGEPGNEDTPAVQNQSG